MAVSVRQSSRMMRSRMSLAVAVAAGAGAVGVYATVSGSSSTAVAAGEAEQPAATLKPIGKTGRNRVILSASAARRLGVETAPVSARLVNGERRVVIPYSAVLYQTNGNAWTYISPKHLVFVRHDIVVDAVRGNLAILSVGPRLGTEVVTVGAPEIWGIEYGGIENAPEASGD
jgi:hypothetical protein